MRQTTRVQAVAAKARGEDIQRRACRDVVRNHLVAERSKPHFRRLHTLQHLHTTVRVGVHKAERRLHDVCRAAQLPQHLVTGRGVSNTGSTQQAAAQQ